MADFIRDIVNPLPGINCAEIAEAVFKALQTPFAVHDLALPSVNDWQAAQPSVNIHFIQNPNALTMRFSNTICDFTDYTWTCTVCYAIAELQQCTPLLEARLAHELTHGIRSSIVHSYNISHPGGRCYYLVTPQKHATRRLFLSATLFGLTNSRFSSGYWIEHNLFGGIRVGLYGLYCVRDPNTMTMNPNPIAIPPEGIFFLLTHQGEEDYHLEEKTFRAKYGRIFNIETRQFGQDTVIYHMGLMTARGSGHDWTCANYMLR